MKKIIHLSDLHVGHEDCAWGIARSYNAGSSTHKSGDIGSQRIIDLSYADPRMDYDGNFI